jgi:hypothetical protein
LQWNIIGVIDSNFQKVVKGLELLLAAVPYLRRRLQTPVQSSPSHSCVQARAPMPGALLLGVSAQKAYPAAFCGLAFNLCKTPSNSQFSKRPRSENRLCC